MEECATCHPVVDGRLLSIRKRRGVGAGNVVGAGGTVEDDETVREAAIREVQEELRVTPTGVEKLGEGVLHFGDDAEDDDSFRFHAFRAEGIDGEPEQTPEAIPRWDPVSQPPYDEMWPDNRIWLPHLLGRRRFRGAFVLAEDGESLSHHELAVGVTFD